MSNEEKIISMLEEIKKEIAELKISVEKTDAEKLDEQKRQSCLKALRDFASVDTPEDKAEVEAFLAFMDAEEERKRKKYGLPA